MHGFAVLAGKKKKKRLTTQTKQQAACPNCRALKMHLLGELTPWSSVQICSREVLHRPMASVALLRALGPRHAYGRESIRKRRFCWKKKKKIPTFLPEGGIPWALSGHGEFAHSLDTLPSLQGWGASPAEALEQATFTTSPSNHSLLGPRVLFPS